MQRQDLPLFAIFLGFVSVAMLVPMAQAALLGDWRVARAFLFCGLFTAFAAATLGVALGRRQSGTVQTELATLVALWFIVPVFAAQPILMITPQIGGIGAWFEMVAAFTTTGGTVYSDPEAVAGPIHLWRGIISWLGGFLTLMAAYVVMAPRRLGGFEVTASVGLEDPSEGRSRLVTLGAATPPAMSRSMRAMRAILPVYTGMTAALILIFEAFGESALTSVVHAAAIVSTSGISPNAGGLAASDNIGVEMVAAVFMVLCATRLLYDKASQVGSVKKWHQDEELRLMALLVALASAALFLRHWYGALTTEEALDTSADALRALWGTLFTALSYITTTGFESASWIAARDWSGLANPGLILLGLCAVGGGAATTAGGIKLIRAHALMRHGFREVERIAQPNGVVGVGSGLRGVLREGAFIAWAFVMLFAGAVFAVMLALAAFGDLSFEEALIASLSALTNTGPAFSVALEGVRDFALLGDAERIILAAAMVLGRIEILGLIALFNTDAWRTPSRSAKTAGKQRRDETVSRW
ncbi:MAG: potassium transporter TrkG [Pseudomonadota bacterium]